MVCALGLSDERPAQCEEWGRGGIVVLAQGSDWHAVPARVRTATAPFEAHDRPGIASAGQKTELPVPGARKGKWEAVDSPYEARPD